MITSPQTWHGPTGSWQPPTPKIPTRDFMVKCYVENLLMNSYVAGNRIKPFKKILQAVKKFDPIFWKVSDNILSFPNYKTNVGLGGSKRGGEIHGMERYSKAKRFFTRWHKKVWSW